MPRTKKKSTSSKKVPKLTQLARVKEGYAKSFDGTRIWYQVSGSGKPAIIFCNGMGCSTFYWKHVHAYFKKSHRVVLFDWRGHGQSAQPEDDSHINISALAEDLSAVMKTLRIGKAILAGHSMGAQVLYEFYKKHPKKVLALVPVCSTFGNPLDTFYNSPASKYVFQGIYHFNHLFPKVANTLAFLMAKNPLWYQMGGFLKMMNPALADRKVLKEYIEHFTSVDPVFLAKLAKSMQDNSAEQLLRDIKVPTMIFAGDNDQFTPVWLSKKMHHLITDSEILVVRKASHVALVEQPALINLRLEKFIHEHFG
ncbi:MAG: alpha/beta hydrolase [Deltaproteobacteria bacterium]|nr:alpha/beta hydrolase [Deltaproteobacteria bacterium]